ncbi:MAG: hypothetical protein KGZ63_05640 [Clostridiales bacterium]|jgi:hypothetical protein|nr:hypothetical protein [Clostridiales bacterium]
MVSWLCPYCKNRMFSSWDFREKRLIDCLYCQLAFINPYYRKSSDLQLAKDKSKST